MLESLRHWFKRGSPPPWLQAWCQRQGCELKRPHDGEGFIVEAPGGDWRIEWGRSHREFLGTHELRLRGAAGLDGLLYGVVMPAAMRQSLDRALFKQFTDNAQTRADASVPEEMRWLAMASRLPAAVLGDLAGRVGGVGEPAPWFALWLGGPLHAALRAWLDGQGEQQGGQPFTLACHLGGVVLRLGTTLPGEAALQAALALFQVALGEARRLAPLSLDDVPPAGGA